MNRRAYTFLLMAAAGAAALAALWAGKKIAPAPQEVANLVIPALAGAEIEGRARFGAFCSACHGKVGEGSANGPPLIHKIYAPSHHGDEAFFVAAQLGVRAHHWSFGNMAKVEGITERDIGAVVAFIRRVQSANGIN